jgi:hypothetical protein
MMITGLRDASPGESLPHANYYPRGPRRLVLGRLAPTHGWPEFSLEQNADERVLVFATL